MLTKIQLAQCATIMAMCLFVAAPGVAMGSDNPLDSTNSNSSLTPIVPTKTDTNIVATTIFPFTLATGTGSVTMGASVCSLTPPCNGDVNGYLASPTSLGIMIPNPNFATTAFVGDPVDDLPPYETTTGNVLIATIANSCPTNLLTQIVITPPTVNIIYASFEYSASSTASPGYIPEALDVTSLSVNSRNLPNSIIPTPPSTTFTGVFNTTPARAGSASLSSPYSFSPAAMNNGTTSTLTSNNFTIVTTANPTQTQLYLLASSTLSLALNLPPSGYTTGTAQFGTGYMGIYATVSFNWTINCNAPTNTVTAP